MTTECRQTVPDKTRLHHELHLAIHSYIDIDSHPDSLLWTDIGLIEEDFSYKWHAMINCHHKDVKCRSGKAFCFTGSEGDFEKCIFFKHLRELEDAANIANSGSLAQLAQEWKLWGSVTNYYVAHHPIERHSWITQRDEILKKFSIEIDTSSSQQFIQARKVCIPENYTAVMMPLVLMQGSEPGFAGCIIVCGPIKPGLKRFDLWQFLPRMKSTAIALLDRNRNLCRKKPIDFSNPARHLVLPVLEKHHFKSGNCLYPNSSQNEHDKALTSCFQPFAILGKFYEKVKNVECDRYLLKALFCWAQLDDSIASAISEPEKEVALETLSMGVCTPQYAFSLASLKQLLVELKIDASISGDGVGCFPTMPGAIAFFGLLNLWYSLNLKSLGATKITLHSDINSMLMHWEFDLIESGSLPYDLLFDKHGNTLKGNTLKALRCAIFGTFHLADEEKIRLGLLSRVVEHRVSKPCKPLMYPQFILGSQPKLALVWPLCDEAKEVFKSLKGSNTNGTGCARKKTK